MIFVPGPMSLCADDYELYSIFKVSYLRTCNAYHRYLVVVICRQRVFLHCNYSRIHWTYIWCTTCHFSQHV